MRRIWRQRRRLILSALAVYLGAVQASVPWSGGSPVLALVPAAGLLALGCAVILGAPAWRGLVPRLGFAALATASIAWAWPTIWMLPSFALVFAGFTLLPLAMAPVARLRPSRVWLTRAGRVIAVPPGRLWNLVVFEDGRTHWDPTVTEVQRLGRVDVYAVTQFFATRRIEVFDSEPPGHFKTRSLDGPGADEGAVTVTSHVLEASPHGTELTLIEGLWRPRLGDVIGLWLDDYLRDHLDRMQAIIEGTADWSVRTALLRAVE